MRLQTKRSWGCRSSSLPAWRLPAQLSSPQRSHRVLLSFTDGSFHYLHVEGCSADLSGPSPFQSPGPPLQSSFCQPGQRTLLR